MVGDARAASIDIRGLRYRYPGAQRRRPGGLDLRVARASSSPWSAPTARASRPWRGCSAAWSGRRRADARRRLRPRPAHATTAGSPRGARSACSSRTRRTSSSARRSRRTSPSASRTSACRRPRSRRASTRCSTLRAGELRDREPHLLSGGQKQRIALAGVLAVPRRLLVLDEPTAMLDPAGRARCWRPCAACAPRASPWSTSPRRWTRWSAPTACVALEAGAVAFDGSPAELFGEAALVHGCRSGCRRPASWAGPARRAGGSSAPLPLTTRRAGRGAGGERVVSAGGAGEPGMDARTAPGQRHAAPGSRDAAERRSVRSSRRPPRSPAAT